ncbi:hypothetical protein BC628DRAFT_1108729 [Trametes gibbosa]|nr:hypothetical protein BC628DRAFT_1108729 [Trametes gibbosa]
MHALAPTNSSWISRPHRMASGLTATYVETDDMTCHRKSGPVSRLTTLVMTVSTSDRPTPRRRTLDEWRTSVEGAVLPFASTTSPRTWTHLAFGLERNVFPGPLHLSRPKLTLYVEDDSIVIRRTDGTFEDRHCANLHGVAPSTLQSPGVCPHAIRVRSLQVAWRLKF